MAHPGDSLREALAEVAAAGQGRDKKAGAKLLRLLGILTLIQGHPQMTARRLAQRFGVTERTIYRDIETLSESGIPLYCDNGYRVAEGFFLPPVQLTVSEWP